MDATDVHEDLEKAHEEAEEIEQKERSIRLQARDIELSLHRGLAIAETYFRVSEKMGREVNQAARDMINNVQMLISLIATAIAAAKSLKMAVAATGIGLIAIGIGEAFNYFSEHPIVWGGGTQGAPPASTGGTAVPETPREEAQRERRERYREQA